MEAAYSCPGCSLGRRSSAAHELLPAYSVKREPHNPKREANDPKEEMLILSQRVAALEAWRLQVEEWRMQEPEADRSVVGASAAKWPVDEQRENSAETSVGSMPSVLPKDSCALTDSIWDAMVLVGVGGQGAGDFWGSVWAVMVLLLNVLVQGTFAYVVSSNLATAE